MLKKLTTIGFATSIAFAPIVVAPMTASAQIPALSPKLTPLNDAPAYATPSKRPVQKLVKKTWASSHRRRPQCVRNC